MCLTKIYFYFFILRMDISDKPQVMIVGTAAGLAGLQAYWVARGWRKNHISTVLFGIVSIALIVGGALLALHLVGR